MTSDPLDPRPGPFISLSLPAGFARWGCFTCGYSYLPSRDPPPYDDCPLCGGGWIDLGPAAPPKPNRLTPPAGGRSK